MNERIKELWKAAAVRDDTVHPWTYDPDMHVEKFAELIVRECADIVIETRWSITPTKEQLANAIKEHFGVE